MPSTAASSTPDQDFGDRAGGLPAVPALLPRTPGGHQFVAYGDSCSGIPGTEHERRFRAVNAVLRRLDPQPDFIRFLGDHIAGYTPDADRLRDQWRHFCDVECRDIHHAATERYDLTSNHNTYSNASIAVWRSQFPALPQDGPRGEEGLAYFVRRDSLLLVMLHTAAVERGGDAGISDAAMAWLNGVLAAHADARHKLVLGHHPLHPVNGYDEHPKWCVPPDEAARVWDVLVRHRVSAYVCSHIIAFDVQVHGGVLQITSGGAGTAYGPGGAMPCPPEYCHLVQLAMDDVGLRLQTRDTAGDVREWLAWPLREASTGGGLIAEGGGSCEVARPVGWGGASTVVHLLTWHFTVSPAPGPDRDLLSAEAGDGVHGFAIGVRAGRLTLRRQDTVGGRRQTTYWHGPVVPGDQIEVAIHTGMGPGGVLWRPPGPDAGWTSMTTSAPTGFAALSWCGRWRFDPSVRAARWWIDTLAFDHECKEAS